MVPGEHLDLSSDGPNREGSGSKSAKDRRFVGVQFTCCDVYTRVYINRDRDRLRGPLPEVCQEGAAGDWAGRDRRAVFYGGVSGDSTAGKGTAWRLASLV